MDVDLIYILNDEASKECITLKGETHRYLIKVRRHEIGDEIFFRNPDNISVLYRYKIKSLDARSLHIELISYEEKIVQSTKSLHIAWCIIDARSIEKVLPSLSEIGVERISFIGCDRTQKNFKLDFSRMKRILEASMQQCGRSTYIEFDRYKNIEQFLKEFPDTKVFDFCDNILGESESFSRVLIGCEGGFSKNEREILKNQDIFMLNTPMVLRSESAVVAIASKMIL